MHGTAYAVHGIVKSVRLSNANQLKGRDLRTSRLVVVWSVWGHAYNASPLIMQHHHGGYICRWGIRSTTVAQAKKQSSGMVQLPPNEWDAREANAAVWVLALMRICVPCYARGLR